MWRQRGVGKKPGGKTPRDKNNNKIRQKFQVGDIQLEKLNDSHANKICLNSLLHDAGHWLQHKKARMKSSTIKSELGRLQKQPHQRGSLGLIGNTKEGSSAE